MLSALSLVQQFLGIRYGKSAYIDTLNEATKVHIGQITGTLHTIDSVDAGDIGAGHSLIAI